MNLNKFKKEIDPLIQSFLQKKVNELPEDKDFQFLKEEFIYIKEFVRDGKRIRPYVAYINYLSFGGKKNKKVIKDLVFLEIFHYFCLIHDDIMDNSRMRHGIKTINEKYGYSEALLLGDFLLSWTWELISSLNLNNKQKNKLILIFNEMTNDVFLGQALDVNSSRKKTISDDLIMKKTLHKTAGYTFKNPMLIGLTLAGKHNNKNKRFCENLGESLGIAFQIQDDLLDITSDFKGNKTPLKDVSEGTHTIFSNYVFKNGSNYQKTVLSDNFGKQKIDIEKVRKVFYDSGAIDYGKKLATKYFNKSKQLANNYNYFLDLIRTIESREK